VSHVHDDAVVRNSFFGHGDEGIKRQPTLRTQFCLQYSGGGSVDFVAGQCVNQKLKGSAQVHAV